MATVKTLSYPEGQRTTTFLKGTTTQSPSWSWSPTGGDSGGGDGGGGGGEPGVALVGTVSISANRSGATAPGGIFYMATATGFFADAGRHANLEERHRHELRYKWNFGEPKSLYTRLDDDMPWDRVYENDTTGEWTVLQGDEVGPNGEGPAGTTFIGYLANHSYGAHSGHIHYLQPGEATTGSDSKGSYVVRSVTVEVLSRDMVLAGLDPVVSEPFLVKIYDADTVYGDQYTAYISPTGDWPAGASNTFNTWYDAVAVARDWPRHRFLFNRGETHDTSHPGLGNTARDDSYRHTSQYDNSQIGAYGTGTPPVSTKGMSNVAPRADSDTGECATWGIDFIGLYDPSRAWEMDESHHVEMAVAADNARFHTVWDCLADGWQRAIAIGPSKSGGAVGNFYGTAWYDYGFFGNTNCDEMTWVGVAIKQKRGTIIAEGKTNTPGYPDHGPWRISAIDRHCIHDMCDYRTLNSHSGDIQPTVRMGGNSYQEYPFKARQIISRTVLENNGGIGTGVFKGAGLFPKSAQYDKIYQIQLGGGDGYFYSCSAPGVSIKNVVSILAAQKLIRGHGGILKNGAHDTTNDGPIDPTCYESPILAYNITAIDHRSEAQADGDNIMSDTNPNDGYYSELTLANFIRHLPNRTASEDAGPFDTTQMLFDRGYDGLLKEPNPDTASGPPPLDTSYARDSSSFARWRPQSGSPAYQSADENAPIAVDDFFGRIRGAVTNKGAVD